MIGSIRTSRTADSSAASPTPTSFSSQYSAHSSSLPRTGTDSSAASMMSSPIQPETPTENLEGDDACSIDPDYWIQREEEKVDDDEIEVSDTLPTSEELRKAGDISIFDADGVARPFKSLYQGTEHQGQRQMIIFVRHFYCGACQHYLKALTETITPSLYFSLPIPTTISIIGCGAPRLIPKYTTRSGCPFRVYADPTRKLYKTLGMRWTIRIGQRPEYIPMNVIKLVTDSLMQMARESKKDTMKRHRLVGGPFTQIGGEFLFQDGEPLWCHRMRNVRNHTEMGQLRKVLEMEDDVAVVEEATAVPLSPTSQAKGLRLVWDGNGVNAHLQRDSRMIESP